MTHEQVPASTSRLKIALAVAWIVAALAVGGWSAGEATPGVAAGDPTAAQAGVLEATERARLAPTGAVQSMPQESPLLTLVIVGAVVSAGAVVLGARLWWSTVVNVQPAPKLTPSPVAASSKRQPRRPLLPTG